jgi:hypothetical protein
VRVAVQKIPGVESVNVSLERAIAEIRLRPGNSVTLSHLRSIVKNNGFTARDASVVVVGALIERGGKPALEVTGTQTVLLIDPDPTQPSVYRQIEDWRQAQMAGPVELAGTVVSKGDEPDRIVASSAKRFDAQRR